MESRDINPRYIIYGHGSVGEAIYWECKRRKWNVICFCEDSTFQKDVSESDIGIFSLSEVYKKKLDGIFIIAISNVDYASRKLIDYGYTNWILACELLNDDIYEKFQYQNKPSNIALREIKACLFEQTHRKSEDKIFIKNLDLEITERCSMRCRDCSNLMQYYKSPKNFIPDEISCWMKCLLNYVEEIYEVRILGGEPFMHKDLGVILKDIIGFPQIHCIVIYSNATIMPNDECWKIMKNKKVSFSITDYGSKSIKIEEIRKKLIELKIDYEIHPAEGWTQGANIVKHNRSEEELKHVLKECCAKSLFTLLNGKLYKCPFIANANNLRAVPDCAMDYVNLSQLEGMDQKVGRKIVRSYLKKEFHNTCDFCDGRFYSSDLLEPAIQIDKPREYIEYE